MIRGGLMTSVRIAVCSLLIGLLVTAFCQQSGPAYRDVGASGSGDNQLTIVTPVNGQSVTDCFPARIEHTYITSGNRIKLTLIRNMTGETVAELLGPECPYGCFPGVWAPCVYLPVGAANGLHTLYARIYKTLTGEVVYEASVLLQVDRLQPVISLEFTPDKDCYNASDPQILVGAIVTDSSGIREWSLSVDGEVVEDGGPEPSPLVVSVAVDLTHLADGTHDVTFYAMDGAGFDPFGQCECGPNVATKTVPFFVDRTLPIVNIDEPGGCLKDVVTFTWTVSNEPPTTPLVETVATIDGIFNFTLPPTTTKLVIDTRTLSDGQHLLRVRVFDECGNMGEDSITFDVCNTSPRVDVAGVVALEQYVGGAGIQSMIEFRDPGTTVVRFSAPITLDAQGNYVAEDVPVGTYDVAVKFSNWLRQVRQGVSVQQPATEIDFFLRNGDAIEDNAVDLQDLSAVLLYFGNSGGVGDLDRSGVVGLEDLVAVLRNQGKVGDT
jgi:hypothetical protein